MNRVDDLAPLASTRGTRRRPETNRRLPSSVGRPSSAAPPARSRVVLLVSLGFYTALGVAFIAVGRHFVGPDGIAYIRIARYWLEGNVDLAITFHWGPLLSWLLVPWLAMGVDGVLGIKIINLVGGGLVLVGVYRLRTSMGLTGPLSSAVQIAAALLVSPWLTQVSPDVLLGALLTLYFAESYRICRSPSVSATVRAGLLGGLAALAKPYGLPFFVLHFTVILLLCVRGPLKMRAARWLAGVASFALLVAPWGAFVATRYGPGAPLASGTIARGWVAPDVRTSDDLPHKWLARVREGRITSWENPAEIPFPWPHWSPLDSWDHFVHQINVIVDNLRTSSDSVFRADLLGLLYIAVVAAPGLALLPSGRRSENRSFLWRWALLGIVVFVGGYVVTLAKAERYLWPIEGLLLVLAGCLLREFCRLWARGGFFVAARRPEVAAGFVLVLSLAGTFGLRARAVLLYPDENGSDTFGVATQLEARNVRGPIAANHWVNGLCVSYRLGQPFWGMPDAKATQSPVDQLRAIGVRTFLLFGGLPGASEMVEELRAAGIVAPLRIEAPGMVVSVYDLTARPHDTTDAAPKNLGLMIPCP